MDTALSLSPIRIHIPESQLQTYIKLIKPFKEAQSTANNEEALTETRLKAVEIAAEIGRTLTGTSEAKPEKLIKRLEEFQQRTPRRKP